MKNLALILATIFLASCRSSSGIEAPVQRSHAQDVSAAKAVPGPNIAPMRASLNLADSPTTAGVTPSPAVTMPAGARPATTGGWYVKQESKIGESYVEDYYDAKGNKTNYFGYQNGNDWSIVQKTPGSGETDGEYSANGPTLPIKNWFDSQPPNSNGLFQTQWLNVPDAAQSTVYFNAKAPATQNPWTTVQPLIANLGGTSQNLFATANGWGLGMNAAATNYSVYNQNPFASGVQNVQPAYSNVQMQGGTFQNFFQTMWQPPGGVNMPSYEGQWIYQNGQYVYQPYGVPR